MASTEMYLTQSTDIAARTLGDDTLIMSTLDSTIFMLNSVGTAIWNAADGATPLSRIVQEHVCPEFEVSEEQAFADAKEFVDELAKHGILLISDAPVSPKEAHEPARRNERKGNRPRHSVGAHMDITWRCNERCVHCYLDHDGKGEMTTDEIKDVLRQLADAGTFFLSISGGEPLMRRDCFEILEYARALRFNVKLKTNAVMIGPKQAARIRKLGIEQVQISLYSHRPRCMTRSPSCPDRCAAPSMAFSNLKANGVKVSVTDVLMKYNHGDARAVKKLAEELGVNFVVDPTITPMLNGDRSILSLGITQAELEEIMHTEEFVGDVAEYCAPISDRMATMFSTGTVAAPATPWPTFHLMARSFRACNSPCRAAACASRASARSGTALRHSPNCVPCMCATCTPAPIARIPLTAPAAPAWPIWKATSAGRHRLTARSRMPAPEFLPPPCYAPGIVSLKFASGLIQISGTSVSRNVIGSAFEWIAAGRHGHRKHAGMRPGMQSLLDLFRGRLGSTPLTTPNSRLCFDVAERKMSCPGQQNVCVFSRGKFTPEQKQRLDEIHREAQLSTFVWTETLKGTLAAFHRADLPMIALKGPCLAERLYGDASLRTCYDLDFLVRASDLSSCRTVCSQTSVFLPTPTPTTTTAVGAAMQSFSNCITTWKIPGLRLRHGCYLGSDAASLSSMVRPFGSSVLSDELLYLCFHAVRHRFERLCLIFDLVSRISPFPARIRPESWNVEP